MTLLVPVANFKRQADSVRKSRCLALFPGSFKPPHEAHLSAVLELASRPQVDEVVVIISNRSRRLPGTDKALDANLAHEIWSIYLQDVGKVRVEIAAHTAVQHALAYFDRVAAGDTLWFCIGELDHAHHDDRFKQLPALVKRTEVTAKVVAVATASIPIRATSLREALARGRSGREVFMAALPQRLTITQRARVWSLCQQGMKATDSLMAHKLGALIDRQELGFGELSAISPVRPDKTDPVYRARFKLGACVYIKYAGDTIASQNPAQTQGLKPRRRLATERRALESLRANILPGQIELPEVIYFDKVTRTLILGEVCPGGRSLQADLSQGVFDPELASKASRFLADCHTLTGPIRPLWGEVETDLRHWRSLLARYTVDIRSDGLPERIRRDLAALWQVSNQACENRFFHLDFCPKNILISGHTIGVIDFERAASVGDPAYELGLLLGHYLYWGLLTAKVDACQKTLMAVLRTYQPALAERWPSMSSRVVAFAGTGLLSNLMDAETTANGFERRFIAIAAALLAQGIDADNDSIVDTAQVLSQTIERLS